MLKCKYCGSRISRLDKNCSNCGADVSDVIEEDDNKRQEELKKRRDHIAEEYNRVSKKMSLVFIAIGIVFVLIFCFVVMGITRSVRSQQESRKSNEKIVEGNFQEQTKNDKFVLSVEETESYNMVADFKGYTDSVMKEGFQQVAFRIKLTNLSGNDVSLFSNYFVLLADGIQMKSCSVLDNANFRHEESGKKFESLNSIVANDATVDGWIGFYVNPEAKKLELKFKNIVIKMDNPVYNGD